MVYTIVVSSSSNFTTAHPYPLYYVASMQLASIRGKPSQLCMILQLVSTYLQCFYKKLKIPC